MQELSFSTLTPLEQDWALLIAVVAFSDRKILRRRGSGWNRHFKVSIPVSDPVLWSRKGIHGPLQELLGCLTGDHWNFSFAKGFQSIVSRSQFFDFDPRALSSILPVSDEMDSFLQSYNLGSPSVESDYARFHVTLGSSDSQAFGKVQPNRIASSELVSVRVSLKVGKHPEPTYRTRPLLFFGLAGLLALKTGTPQVIVGENGISSIGPRFIHYGGEHPPCGTHPIFTRQLSRFLSILFDKNVHFEHSNLFKTKGQMLTSMSPTLRNMLLMTCSCVRGPRDGFGDVQCGLCSGCLYRRVSLAATGMEEECYHWNDLSGATLERCQQQLSERLVTDNDRGLARHAIHSFESLAQLEGLSNYDRRIRRSAFELAHYDSDRIPMIGSQIVTLIGHHAKEWNAFKERFKQGSILRSFEAYKPRGGLP